MKLVHYAAEPVVLDDREYPTCSSNFKPIGLWLSDDSSENNWRNWCEDQEFRTRNLKYVHDVELTDTHNILVIKSITEFSDFHDRFFIQDYFKFGYKFCPIDWSSVKSQFDGVIITPYILENRNEYMWYSCWDCSSGCVWNMKAIKSFKLREENGV